MRFKCKLCELYEAVRNDILSDDPPLEAIALLLIVIFSLARDWSKRVT